MKGKDMILPCINFFSDIDPLTNCPASVIKNFIAWSFIAKTFLSIKFNRYVRIKFDEKVDA
jgi:hypothetical protein